MTTARKAAIGFLPIIIITLAFGSYLGIVLSSTPTLSTSASPNETANLTLVSCIQTGPSQQVYVNVVSDNSSNTPIQGADVSGWLNVNCGSGQSSFSFQSEITPINGTVPLDVAGCDCSLGNYTVTIRNGTSSYQVEFSPPMEHLAQTVVVTIGIPSARVIDMHITNTGVCTGNVTTIVNGTGFFC